MSDIFTNYNLSDIIAFLEKYDFEKFLFKDGSAYIDAVETQEIEIESSGDIISEDTAKFAIKVLKSLDECTSLAYNWLKDFNLKNKKYHSDALDGGYEINGVYIGRYEYGGVRRKPLTDGFTITFDTKNYYPCSFTVKFNKNMWPFAIEEWVY